MKLFWIGCALGLSVGIGLGLWTVIHNEQMDQEFYQPFTGKVCMTEEFAHWLVEVHK